MGRWGLGSLGPGSAARCTAAERGKIDGSAKARHPVKVVRQHSMQSRSSHYDLVLFHSHVAHTLHVYALRVRRSLGRPARRLESDVARASDMPIDRRLYVSRCAL